MTFRHLYKGSCNWSRGNNIKYIFTDIHSFSHKVSRVLTWYQWAFCCSFYLDIFILHFRSSSFSLLLPWQQFLWFLIHQTLTSLAMVIALEFLLFLSNWMVWIIILGFMMFPSLFTWRTSFTSSMVCFLILLLVPPCLAIGIVVIPSSSRGLFSLLMLIWMDITFEIWNTLRKCHYQGDVFRIYSIQEDIYSLCQGSLIITTYFTPLQNLWQELDQFRPLPCCSYEIKFSCNLIPTVSSYRDGDCVLHLIKGLNE